MPSSEISKLQTLLLSWLSLKSSVIMK